MNLSYLHINSFVSSYYTHYYLRYFAMLKVLVALLFLQVILSSHLLKKVLVDDPDALCLDGTKAAYYVY